MIEFMKNKRDGFGRIGIVLILPFVILVIAYSVYQLFFIPEPIINGTEAFDFISADKTIRLDGENIKSIDISIYQEGKKIDLLKDAPETGEKVYSLEIKPKEMGLTDGRAIVTIKAKSGMVRKVQYDLESVIDTVPPSIEVLKAPQSIDRGSGGLVALRASGEAHIFIKLVDKDHPGEDKIFKAYKVDGEAGVDKERPVRNEGEAESNTQNSKRSKTALYYTFFPAPFDSGNGVVYYAVATDTAGNQSISALPTRLKMKKYNKSSINIDDAFIYTVVAPLLNETHISDTAAAFKKVNEEWRKQSLERLKEIAIETEPAILWKGRFLQLKNSKVMATYGDKRTYYYNGKNISKSAHLGYDLASHAKADVEAANSGIVLFAENLSIYGNTVIIDHGLGLMSLYGHLSAITVSKGERVTKGQIIAATGSTGLAGGDHLHFGILMHGYEVSPLYWWDSNWIKVNVADIWNSRQKLP